MEFLYEKDKSEGKISGRSDWRTDNNLRKSIKKRAIALILDFENNRHLLEKQVNCFPSLFYFIWLSFMCCMNIIG